MMLKLALSSIGSSFVYDVSVLEPVSMDMAYTLWQTWKNICVNGIKKKLIRCTERSNSLYIMWDENHLSFVGEILWHDWSGTSQ